MTLALLALAALAPSDVIDVGAGGTYPDIQSAVLAATDGDVLRVAPGEYDSFAVFDKWLTIVPSNGSFSVRGVVRVQELSLGKSFVMQGAELLQDPLNYGEERLILGFNEGSVRLESVHARQTDSVGPYPWLDGTRPARIVDCRDVSLVDCVFGPVTGVDPSLEYFDGGGGMAIIDSTVAMFGCTVDAEHAPYDAGIHCTRSELLGVGLDVSGSSGGFSAPGGGFGLSCEGDPHGGSWGVFLDADSSMTRVGGTIDGGTDGYDYCNNVPYPARPPFGGTGALVEIDGEPLLLTAPPVAVDGSTASVTVRGGADDLVFLVMGPFAWRRDLPGFVGDLLLGGPAGSVQRFVLGTGSTLNGQVQLPTVAPFEIDALHLQAAHVRPDATAPGGSRILFGPPRVVTILDAAW